MNFTDTAAGMLMQVLCKTFNLIYFSEYTPALALGIPLYNNTLLYYVEITYNILI